MTADQLSSFWGTVAQIVPVLALTLVLELRRAATHWSLDRKTERRLESTALLAVAIILFALFQDALSGLRGRPTMEPRMAASLLVMTLFLLAINPIWLGAMRANMDLLYLAERLTTRMLGRRARKIDALEVEIQAGLGTLDRALAGTRKVTAAPSLIS